MKGAEEHNEVHYTARDQMDETRMHRETIEELLRRNADIEARNTEGQTALHCASAAGQTECMDALVNVDRACTESADIMARTTKDGWSPLHFATSSGFSSAVRFLLTCKANPNSRTVHDRTSLHLAAHHGWQKPAELLLAAGADPRIKDGVGRTAFTTASQAKRYKISMLLNNAREAFDEIRAAVLQMNNKQEDAMEYVLTKVGESGYYGLIQDIERQKNNKQWMERLVAKNGKYSVLGALVRLFDVAYRHKNQLGGINNTSAF